MSTQSQTEKNVVTPDPVRDPLLTVDWVIQQNRDKDITPGGQKRLKKLVLRSILALAGRVVEEDEAVEDEAKNMLDKHGELVQKKLVAACYLRLLPEPCMQWLSEAPWRPKVVELFDAQFADDVYRERKVEISLMPHQKVARLTAVVQEEEAYFLQGLSMLTSLERLNALRQRVMSTINSRTGKVMLRPFLPDNIEAQLGEVFKCAESYLEQRDDLSVVDARVIANEEIERFVRTLEAGGTLYGHWVAEHLGKSLLAFIESDFANNKAAQPAQVSIEARDKKYPFGLVGREVHLSFLAKNSGAGYAYGTKLAAAGDDNIKILAEEIELGRLAPATRQLVTIPIQVVQPQSNISIVLEVSWRDFDNTRHSMDLSFVVEAQRCDIDWEQLEQSDPYSLEPVTSEQELVGRKATLNRLIGIVKAPNVGSAIIHGQKRVGKTSIAKALQSHLQRLRYLVVYIEAGDYVEPTARATVSRLGVKLCRMIKELEPRVAHLNTPSFEEALSPLAEFLEDATKIVSDRRIVIVLDEFDQLPLDLYLRGSLGDAFFLTLRSISSRPSIGFVLVGGERMAHIMDCQGDQLNKWSVIPVDYFTRESDWPDYRELIQRPVGDTLEYTEDAIVALHEITSGNPYFTKLVCNQAFHTAVSKRDCYITRPEIDQAVETTTREAKLNTFQHFWEDGIFETGERETEKSIRRRKILIALSDALSKQSPCPYKLVAVHPLVQDVVPLETDLKEFVTRKVLVSSLHEDVFEFKVQLFHRWLKGCGIQDVIATFSDLDTALRNRQQEEKTKVQPGEIVKLIGRWGSYKGQAITEDKVRVWLDQFGEVREQRAMFTILDGLRFYPNAYVRQKMAEVHDIVRRGLVRYVEQGKLKRSDILASYLDSPAKSGSHFARLYADEAAIYAGNVIEKGKLAEALLTKMDIKALVFVDDFVGTGEQASEYLKELNAMLAATVRERDIKVIFVAVVAFIEGWKRIEEIADSLDMSVRVHACEVLDETAKCFGERSSFFPDPNQRDLAKKAAERYGRILEKNCPLGYGGLELAVVFERSCPNDSLPILWSESTSPKWVPLFKRN